ncbi:STAS domain-containing protein [Dactylosporangium sp. AC04546]|uniref:STAS domain-containing protein n=1 Tax=Dactylosporangium sp. AC04546 TaxID=2862460 RepID=UPI001EE04468|nr:STAS domain-containing protein [Dactylosporangium sp. AC04546]WVK79831.1 STAS domain-containing protein [Dactylosporangium sp. AC04546]
MAFSISTVGGHGLVTADGELDVSTSAEFRRTVNTVLDDGDGTLVIDLSAVTFMDSTTLGVLIGAYNRVRDAGGSLAVVCPDRIRRVFRITGLDQVFRLCDTVESAAAALG